MLDPYSLSLSARALGEALLVKLYEKNLLSHQDGIDVINEALISLDRLKRDKEPEEEVFSSARAILNRMKDISTDPLPNDRI